MSKQHVLKIHKAPLEALLSGAKTCEIRFNDRGFEVGDTVVLREVNPVTEAFTGRPDHVRTITHIQQGYGLPDHLCVLSYAQPAAGEPIHQWADQDLWMDGDEADMASARAEGFKTRTLWAAPPAAAHGDEAVRSLVGMAGLYNTAQEELDALRKDAERYRWLRDPAYTRWGTMFKLYRAGAELDSAIDAAMRAQGDGEVQ